MLMFHKLNFTSSIVGRLWIHLCGDIMHLCRDLSTADILFAKMIYSRLVFSSSKEDVLGRHDGPVRCVEYSYAAGTCGLVEIILDFHYGIFGASNNKYLGYVTVV